MSVNAAAVCSVLVIGIGNEYRRDDGIGPALARKLAAMRIKGLRVAERAGADAALLDMWQGADLVILVDAMSSGADAGTIHRIDATAREVPRLFRHGSTHGLGLAETVELARALDRLPRQLLIYGIEGKDFSAGAGLTAAAECAITIAADEIREQIPGAQE